MLSFVFVAIYWVNHHHLMQVVYRIDGRTLWANILLLFWLSLTPIATAWLGRGGRGVRAGRRRTRSCCSAARSPTPFLTLAPARLHEPDSQLAQAIGSDRKGKVVARHLRGRVRVRVRRPLGLVGLFVAVAVMWFIPDRRIERVLFDRV